VDARAAIEDVRAAAVRLVRNLPEAHLRVERPIRALVFSSSAKAFVKRVYALETAGFIDRDLEEVEDIVRAGLRVLLVHMADLDRLRRRGSTGDRHPMHALVEKLEGGLEGIERGLPPDPAKRPTREQMLQKLAAHLTSIRLA
jgi:hypothetical protein